MSIAFSSMQTEATVIAQQLESLASSAPTVGAPTTGLRLTSRRNAEIDFVKGFLVLVMVFYHWANYFMAGRFDFRYLRFLTPSFIFITGFLISNVYMPRYGIGDGRSAKRLAERGLKLLLIFASLNAFIRLAAGSGQLSIQTVARVFIVGDVSIVGTMKGMSFYILVPISYLLLLSGLLMIACRSVSYAFHLAFAALIAAMLALYAADISSPNVELLSMGVLGVVCGYVPLRRITQWASHVAVLAVAYACYVAAIAVWDVRYPLQIVGVCLTVMIAYRLGGPALHEHGPIRRLFILVGQYSLFGYIAQIAILQLLRRALANLPMAYGVPGSVPAVALAAAMCLTVLAIEMMDHIRKRGPFIDDAYRMVFG
jgi:hypothetical protein